MGYTIYLLFYGCKSKIFILTIDIIKYNFFNVYDDIHQFVCFFYVCNKLIFKQ